MSNPTGFTDAWCACGIPFATAACSLACRLPPGPVGSLAVQDCQRAVLHTRIWNSDSFSSLSSNSFLPLPANTCMLAAV